LIPAKPGNQSRQTGGQVALASAFWRIMGCRDYPFTDKPDFTFMSITHANNAVVWPTVFYLVEKMKRWLGR
jgi:hypothetical protein